MTEKKTYLTLIPKQHYIKLYSNAEKLNVTTKHLLKKLINLLDSGKIDNEIKEELLKEEPTQ
ncbi:MAG: hypothetical protein PHW29_04405 [Flavobacterium sp.]|nr:hypothetical protein [Flavobacterium sp.]